MDQQKTTYVAVCRFSSAAKNTDQIVTTAGSRATYGSADTAKQMEKIRTQPK